MTYPKLLILGASGACGQHAVSLARERGHDITVIVRSESRYEKPQGVEVVEGM